MPILYRYKAIDALGKVRSDSIEADNLLDLEKRLLGMEMELLNYKEQKTRQFSFMRHHVSRKELINFTFQMQQLTKSGVSILDGLADLKDSTHNVRMKKVLCGVTDEIHGGKTFSCALSRFPDVFDKIYIALIRAGEETGCIPDVLHDMAETLKWHDELISHTQKIMIYPALVTLVITAVVSYLMIFLVPELIPFIEELGGNIPLHTQALIASSWFLGHYWFLVFGMPIGIFIILRMLANRKPTVRLLIDKTKLKLYIFGPIILKTHLARFSKTFAMMYSSGLTVLDCLKISECIMGNALLSQSINDIRQKIIEGGNISNSFASSNIYPSLVIRMLKVGENTGALDEALLNISYFYNREVKESVDKMEAAITPLLTIIMGGIMMWIMSAVLGPIYDSLTRIQL